MLELLESFGGSLQVQNKFGATPLHRAAMAGALKATDWLLRQGVSLYLKNKDQRTALECAKLKGHHSISNLILKTQQKRESLMWLSPDDKERLHQEALGQAKLDDTEAVVSTYIEVKSGDNTFLILKTVTRQEAEALYKQERVLIPFKEQEKTAKAVFGEGHFGKVTPGKYINGKGEVLYVGVKKVKEDKALLSEKEDAHHYHLSGLPHIIPFYGSVKTSSTRYQFMALGGLGNGERLSSMIALVSLTSPEQHKIWIYVTQCLLTGLAGMHTKCAYHLDLKPANLVINGWGEVYLIDFGCMVKLTSKDSTTITTPETGDFRYGSFSRLLVRYTKRHQLSQERSFDMAKEDVWTAGITLLEMMQNSKSLSNSPFSWLEKDEVLSLLDASSPPNLDYFKKKLSSIEPLQSPPKGSLWELIGQMLSPEEDKRPTPSECLQHPIFQDKKYQFSSKEERIGVFAKLQDEYTNASTPKSIAKAIY